jgi:hypothetical protein
MQAKSLLTIAAIVVPSVLAGLFVSYQGQKPQIMNPATPAFNTVEIINKTDLQRRTLDKVRDALGQHAALDEVSFFENLDSICDTNPNEAELFEAIGQQDNVNAGVLVAAIAVEYCQGKGVSIGQPAPTPQPTIVIQPTVVAVPVPVAVETVPPGIHTNDAVNPEFNAIVFDPPSNCRANPGNDGEIVRKFEQYGEVAVNARNPQNGWYFEVLNTCWIHESQLQFH